MPQIDYAILANYAEFGPDGRLAMVGGDLNGFRGTFPLQIQPITLAMRVNFLPEECNRDYGLTAELLPPDGAALASLAIPPFRPPAPSIPDREMAAAVVMQFQGIVFPVPGRYQMRLSINGREMKTIILRLEDSPQPP
jgi:hypothetical protein